MDSPQSTDPQTPADVSHDGGSQTVRLPTGLDFDGTPIASAVLTPDSDRCVKEIHCDPRTPIPVIFLPGVMGSLLANSQNGREVWYPPNMDGVASGFAAFFAVLRGWLRGAASRAARFDPEPAVVDPRGPLISIDEAKLGIDAAEARRRGWSTLHRWSYQPTLEWLKGALNKPMQYGEPIGEWANGSEDGEKSALKPVLGTHPSEYGGYGAGEALTLDSEVFKTFVSYRYPVYAIGYNFLQSNELSARDVLDGVDFEDKRRKKKTRIMGVREICRENHTDKAIIVTHSMGGLVARMAAVLCGGADDMLAVLHGAQPATGAPVFARRFRAGGEGRSGLERFINQSLFGANAREFIAVASYAQGPMELAPMPDYNNGEPWWIVVDAKGRERLRFPETSALEDLYVSDAWYGLLPDPKLLDPAGVVAKYLKREEINMSVHVYYKNVIAAVVRRQEALASTYHPNTYAMFGSGALEPSPVNAGRELQKVEISKPEGELLTFGKVIWQGDIPDDVSPEELKRAELEEDDHKGKLKLRVRGQLVVLTVWKEMRQADLRNDGVKDSGVIPGDGTVPAWSSEAQARGLIPEVAGQAAQGVQMAFRQKGYEHQFSFRHPWTRWATLYSVAQAVHKIKGGCSQ
ncbi:hypothetical protein D9X30_3108 [Cupriavidus sp. U2]|uniref:esterase/lipase family protein n=1 Tax=Cupriavidus sp. U2 TaxID=2920269 RepID=UPI00129DD9A3|nr:alpha/beta fold hydrolase [Cupriavidus sp. U2]KAI3591823.1 hypothetical protein D9X30_3108 [Cupriavidus sp. U2]